MTQLSMIIKFNYQWTPGFLYRWGIGQYFTIPSLQYGSWTKTSFEKIDRGI